jgi:hypothetical protein
MTIDDGLNFNLLQNKLCLIPAIDVKQTISHDADGSHHEDDYDEEATDEDNDKHENEGEDVMDEDECDGDGEEGIRDEQGEQHGHCSIGGGALFHENDGHSRWWYRSV